MSDRKKGLEVLEDDALDAIHLRLERIGTLLSCLEPESLKSDNAMVRRLVYLLVTELDHAEQEQRILLEVSNG